MVKQSKESRKRGDSLRVAFVFALLCLWHYEKDFAEHLEDYSALAPDKCLNFDVIFKPSA